MSPLRQHLADYLTMRRALGYELRRQEKLLGQLVDHLERRGAETLSTELVFEWATLPGGARAWHALRLGAARGFARYLRTLDPSCEVPPAALLPRRADRAVPFIYSEGEIVALMEATRTLRTPHRRSTYRTLIGLLAATGMRVGEAIALDRGDIGWGAGVLRVRGAKFGKSRELPLDPSVVSALRRYFDRADRPSSNEDALFVSWSGTRLLYTCVHRTFGRLLAEAGIEPRSERCRPRPHDLRHSFAVRTILDGYRAGVDGEVGRRLALLATYLGHTDPAHTYWYLEAAPELMQLTVERLERHLGGER